MSFFSNLFKKKEKTPVEKPPKTRADLESTLFVRYEDCDDKLKSAFVKTRVPEADEKKRLREIFDLIESVPDGKKLIADVATAGYKINFDSFCGASAGACNPAEKSIMLCPANHPNDAAIAASLYHEMTHAMQNERSGGLLRDSSAYKIADQVKFLRAAEASAWMEEAKFVYQIKDSRPEVLKFVDSYPMYRAFAAEMEKSADVGKACAASFKSWYGFKEYQTGYENQHIAIIKNRTLDRIRKQDAKAFRQDLPSEDVLNHVVISEKTPIDPTFLTTPEAFSLSDDAVRSFEALSNGYARKFLKSKDESVGKMYSSETGETVAGKGKETAGNTRSKSSVMSALTSVSKARTVEKAVLTASKNKVR